MNDQVVNKQIKFLGGPQSRWNDFKFAISVFGEFIKGFRTLHFVGPCVTIFGSARFASDHIYYKQTEKIAGLIAELGFTIMTGGGPGIMEAANKGAKAVGGRSVGCNIVLPHEQQHNPYLDTWVSIKYFFVRKTLLLKYSYAFVVMPGGFGTLDEFYETLTLIQTKMIKQFPIIIFDKAFHEKVMEHNEVLMKNKTISPQDLDLCLFTDSIEDAIKHLQDNAITKFNLKPKALKKAWWFFEK